MAKVSWQTLAVKLPEYSEEEIEQMLDDEISTHKRTAIARRLHQRLCKLRMLRERDELTERMKK
jgi:hypothetical protein